MRRVYLGVRLLGGLMAVTAACFAGPSWGQEAPGAVKPDAGAEVEAVSPEGDKKETTEGEKAVSEETKEAPRGGFLGDTSRFSRAGGWGSIGGAMGQWGLAKSMLVMLPPVQEELELTEAQKQALKEWGEQMRTRGEEWGRGMREQGGGEDPFGGGGGNVSIAARMQQFMGFMSQVNVILKENEAGVSRILDKDQRIRLGQIAYQMEGVGAVLRPEVAKALNLSPSQQIRIQQVLTRSRTVQMTTWMSQMMTMGSMRDRRREGGGETGASGGERAGPQAGPRAQAGPSAGGSAGTGESRPVDPARAERMRAMQKQFETTRDRNDQLQEQTATEVIKVLTVRQRKTFDKILGEPFDPAQVNNLARPRERDRSKAAETAKDESGSAESEAPKSPAPTVPRP